MNNQDKMSMAKRRAAGLLWVDTGENINQQIYARGLCQEFNRTKPTESTKRAEILNKLFGTVVTKYGLNLH